MKYKATPKFKKLTRANSHQGLDKKDFDRLLDGKTVNDPPKKLIEGGYLKKEASHGS